MSVEACVTGGDFEIIFFEIIFLAFLGHLQSKFRELKTFFKIRDICLFYPYADIKPVSQHSESSTKFYVSAKLPMGRKRGIVKIYRQCQILFLVAVCKDIAFTML